MNFYDKFMRPLENALFHELRQQLIPDATGNVLEIGIGTGANLPFYNYENISQITGVDIQFDSILKERMNEKVKFYQIDGKTIPFDDDTFDYVVSTLVLCGVEDIDAYMLELKRVLKSSGRFIFIEHIKPEISPYTAIVNAVAKPWHMVASCHLDRETDKVLPEYFDIDFMQKAGKTMVCYGVASNNK